MSDDRPPTKRKRLWKLASMTAGVAGDYAKSRVRHMVGQDEDEASLRRKTGERVAATLGELKGAAMKVGQMASAAKELLPPEVADALASLQKGAPPMSYEVIAEQIESELGSPPEMLFQRFDKVPFAAASVGQVHRATTDDGREVVVKVQYPGVDGAVDSDLSHVKLALRLGGLVSVEKQHLDAIFDELRDRLHEELDYCNEADNVRLFRKFHQQHPFLVVPDVVGERSAQRILTLTYEPGDPLSDLEADGVSTELRDQVGTNMAKMIASQLFELGSIQADPNPANYAYRPDGTLVLYDFGCVKTYDRQYLDLILDLLRAADKRDYPGLDQAMVGLGPLRKEHAPVPPEYYDRWLNVLAPPLWDPNGFAFGSADLGKQVIKLVPGVIKRQAWWKPAPELTMVDRAVAGQYDIVRAMHAHVPLRDILLAYMEPDLALVSAP